MIINHNLSAMNAHRQLGSNQAAGAKAQEKLSSGLRINRAGDDAAGLAISEKMRAQVRGLDQASRNSQDGISMIQTAEGALQETHSILQRMRELATQAANDTNVGVDRNEIQKEIDSLTTEINRIGNTTEFNSQKILKGDGASNLEKSGLDVKGKLAGGVSSTTEAKQTLAFQGTSTGNVVVNLNGEELTVNVADAGSAAERAANFAAGLSDAINNNSVLKGNYEVTVTGTDATIAATKGGTFEGNKGILSAATLTGATDITGGTAGVGTNNEEAASKEISFASIASNNDLSNLVGKGITIDGQQVEFYNSNTDAYKGEAIGIDISSALVSTNKADALVNAIAAHSDKFTNVSLTADADELVVTALKTGEAGNSIEISDGGIKENFQAKFQVGANKGQSMSINIEDMRASALGITGKAGDEGFTSGNSVSNGTDQNLAEASLDVSSFDKATAAIETINNAIEQVSSERSKLGSFQNRLEHTISNLDNSSENLQAAESRIRDVDMAKEIMEFTKNNILSQASQSMLAQANQAPQQVLQLLG